MHSKKVRKSKFKIDKYAFIFSFVYFYLTFREDMVILFEDLLEVNTFYLPT